MSVTTETSNKKVVPVRGAEETAETAEDVLSLSEPDRTNPTAVPKEIIAAPPRNDLSQSRFYRTIWRWHFYAGLITLPVLLVATITGALYVFVEELEPVLYPKLMVVEPQAARVSFETQLEAARRFAPATSIDGFTSSDHADHSTRVWASQGDEYFTIFVNPYTGEVLGEMQNGFFEVVLSLHRTLLAGSAGRVAVELATSWGIVLIITGLYLWLPRRQNKFWGVWLPRLRTKSYVVWRDLHTVGSLYLSIFTFLILLTGLAFSFIVGQSFFQFNLQTGGIPKSIFDPPKVAAPADPNAAKISIDEAIAISREHLRGGDHLDVTLPQREWTVYGVTSGDHDDPSTFAGVYINPYTGEKLDVVDWKQFSIGAKSLLYSYSIHVGSIYGMPTKILAFLVCLGLIFASISGAVMWWIRRPKGKLGTPKISKPMVLTIIVLGVLMPTVGLSLLLILLADWTARKFMRRNTQELAN